MAQQLEGQIRANLNNRDRLLNSVRAYLMLGMPERRDNAWLKAWVATDWSARYPGNSNVFGALLIPDTTAFTFNRNKFRR